jgi:3-hydroxymyristoyl/3-hydroxydecanoyl-(acyl carrier protein) dehydratase
MINNYPEITKTTNVSENHIVITMILNVNCEFFNGHFDNTPILPGIAQIDTAIKMASKLFDIEKRNFKNIPVAKFKKVLIPGDIIDLHLTRRVDAISFEYKFDGDVASSGRLRYE